ncbi:uncharacterized protein LOC133039801 [Cannabis sativa]|uniref:uncharacterized protein LOC133039801 n=1 Tax=Cannabis sativa TaxID=3483 RepID=UPI0029CA1D5C|nr:uncharacterized protein LOC133039801 [Cannabis sativa]
MAISILSILSQTKVRLLQLKGQFSHFQKGTMSIFEYIEKVQSIFDALTVVGSPVQDQDLVLKVLNGLGPNFDSIVFGITSRSNNLTIEEVQALFLSYESKLEHHHQMNDLSMRQKKSKLFFCSFI